MKKPPDSSAQERHPHATALPMRADVFRTGLILTGPTASGKSALALELAEPLNAEIIAMDSMTLYRGMDIGTAKPTPADRSRVPHHLLDALDPWESASVAWWLEQATNCCKKIEERGRRALFVGGTPLYLKALLFGLFDGPPADSAVRARLESDAAREGTTALHARLALIDPLSAQRLHPNDLRRVIRALEVFELTGRPLSEWQTEWRRPSPSNNSDSPRCFCLEVERSELYSRINRRVQQMITDGLVDEARALRTSSRPLSREAAQAVGYREAFDYLEGRCSLEEMRERIQLRSRQLAKRQLTWFRALPECLTIRPELTFAARALKILERLS
jgi:tRNA dimethylallyltransferase